MSQHTPEGARGAENRSLVQQLTCNHIFAFLLEKRFCKHVSVAWTSFPRCLLHTAVSVGRGELEVHMSQSLAALMKIRFPV